ncbi:MAG: formylmethanofuran dehydrogenase subunit A [Acidobacteriota bacterium]
MPTLRIRNGRVYDPARGQRGGICDVCIQDGKIVESLPGDAPVLDARNLIVLPGGVDIHSHIAGPKVNIGRALRPEDHRHDPVPGTRVRRSGTGGSVPSVFITGYRYAEMGYTTVMEAAVPPLGARHAHEELNDTPMFDKGIYTLMGSNQFILKYIREKRPDKVRDFVAWLLRATKGYAIKLVNPGGVENWKYGGDVKGLDDPVNDFDVTPRQIITSIARANEELGLPHTIHLHCNNLGVPGNYALTLETLEALRDHRLHLTHAQFHCYGGTSWAGFSTKAAEIAEYVNTHPNVTMDVGQIIFGDTTTMTADGPWQYRLHGLTHRKWYNADVELESSCGIVPYVFKEKNVVNAMQWAIGLELFLLVRDPWRIYLTTDHPNGGSFIFYPHIIRLLMDREFRAQCLRRVHPRILRETALEHLDREYTLEEIAIITRAGPARALGLAHKGHLGAGADADVAIYKEDSDREAMFEHPVYVLKGGEVVVREGEIVKQVFGRTLFADVPEPVEIQKEIRDDFEKYYTVQFENYPFPVEAFRAYRPVAVERRARAS